MPFPTREFRLIRWLPYRRGQGGAGRDGPKTLADSFKIFASFSFKMLSMKLAIRAGGSGDCAGSNWRWSDRRIRSSYRNKINRIFQRATKASPCFSGFSVHKTNRINWGSILKFPVGVGKHLVNAKMNRLLIFYQRAARPDSGLADFLLVPYCQAPSSPIPFNRQLEQYQIIIIIIIITTTTTIITVILTNSKES